MALAMVVLLTVNSGHGCHEEEPFLRTPVTAVATLLDGGDGTVSVELVVISTGLTPQQPVPARALELHTPDGDALPLLTVAPGHYRLTSDDDPALRYQPDLAYRLSFSVDEAEAATNHVFAGELDIELFASSQPPTAWIEQATTPDGGAVVAWAPARAALVEVVGEGDETTYRNVDFAHEPIDYASWEALAPRGSAPLPAEAFGVGKHLVRVCTVDVHRPGSTPAAAPQHDGPGSALSGRLGSLSGSLGGRCAAVELIRDPVE